MLASYRKTAKPPNQRKDAIPRVSVARRNAFWGRRDTSRLYLPTGGIPGMVILPQPPYLSRLPVPPAAAPRERSEIRLSFAILLRDIDHRNHCC